jgi:Cys-tRNA(Pro) deacylase
MPPPVTAAIRALRAKGVAFEPHEFEYVERGGTAHSSQVLGVPEHAVIKTLVMETEAKKPLVVLMHGDREVSTKNLARQIEAKMVQPCKPEIALKWSGYQVGGTSPFGLKTAMPIYVERTILELPRIWINGGGRGFLVSLDPRRLRDVIAIEEVDVALTKTS